MKLLFDENLSPRLVRVVEAAFPDSAHVHDLGLGNTEDMQVWAYARDHGFDLVTKDADYNDLGLLRGYPPRIVWIRRGNCSTADIADLLTRRIPDIQAMQDDPATGVLILF
ncbi:MAG: DUF5615 family PIN-like protein [Pseudomonadota bacterium]